MTPDPAAVLRSVCALGPYFAVETGTVPPSGYQPLRTLFSTGPDAPLAARIREVAAKLRTTEPRVAASITHLGLAARFWSVTLGLLMAGGLVPEFDPDGVHWRQPADGPLDLWLPGTALRPAGPAPADDVHRAAVAGALAPLAAAVRAAAPVADGLLAGNAASALVGTARQLGRGFAEPERSRAAVITAGLLAREPLFGTLHPGSLRRSSCCLYYRIPGGGLCGDCVFDRPPGRAVNPGAAG
ncbi:(2Fe-2S)-binding protein [Kitasatospora sp. RB6PN24]|uniref:(2Fe-2S)-binding protein n=1 Tax=Kitasatospora humi TaxID=2893891 RepID=UPI001E401C00|nr:(2Fe-2S)-binding protein [Kitasatospora humi]MCC9310659.1 (2Fe-2S)-binding protein [Kitasatospora humi]